MVFGGFAGVWEFASFGQLPEDQRAPGRLDHATRTLALGWIFDGVWEFVPHEKRLRCVCLGRIP